MLLTTEGIVLNTTKYGDSSFISKIFTKEKGIISTITNRSKSNKKHLYLQAFTCVELVCYMKQSNHIHRIKEIGFPEFYDYNPNHIIKASISFFIAEFLSKTIKEEEQNLILYGYIRSVLFDLTKADNIDPWFIISFLTKLTKLLGIEPELNQHNKCFDLLNAEFISKYPNHKNYLSERESVLFYKVFSEDRSLTSQERKGIIKNLIQYYSIQLDTKINLNSLPIIEAVFS